MQIGLRAHDYANNVSPEELAEILAVYHPASIQLALAKALSCGSAPGQLSPGFARRIRQILEKKDISIAVLGCYINPVHPDPQERENQLRRFEEHLRFARDFGCALVGTETGSCNGNCSFHPDTEKSSTFDLFCSSLERLLKTAEKCGSIVAIEAVADIHTISTIEKMEQVLRRLASPALKVIYDPVNLIPNAGLTESHEQFFTRAFNAFGNEIAVIHAKDFRIEENKKNGMLPAGTGELDYPALLRIIMARKSGIDILLENTNPASGFKAMEFLKAQMELGTPQS
ncbi:MAG: sugar phosphate isomerase/epimerase [Treponema sp.]|jgi:sugar phosphate isomerase/epimerase|nr:sugar phosphate isomerase/epimerase [Treponema sp.]